MKPDEYFASESKRLESDFAKGSYPAFMEALLLHVENNQPLPQWISEVVIKQAEAEWLNGKIGPGRHGNWPATDKALNIHKWRAELAVFHLNARQKTGKKYISELGRIFGYGREDPDSALHIVTRDDVFEFVSNSLRGTPAQGSAEQIKESHKLVNGTRKKRNHKPGGE